MNRTSWKHLDPYLFAFACAATLLGLIFILDSGYARSLQNGWGYLPPEFKSQFQFLIPSAIAYLVVSRIAPERWFKASKVLWILSMLSLVAVELIGVKMNGAQRWLALGPITVQPAEFTKIATVLYLAGCFANRPKLPDKKYANFAAWADHRLWPMVKRALPAIWVLVAVVLIEKEPDLGTGAVVAATAFAMFFPGGASWRSIGIAAGCALLGALYMVKAEPYRMERIANHTQRWEQKNVDDIAFQTVQSESAMASGGIVGVGIGAGRAKHVMPATTTDFVMATVAEEFGLIGALLTLGVLGGLVARMLQLAQRSENRFRMLVLFGVAAWIGIQTCVNVMMANGFWPAIGIPLPFISSGGSSLFALWIAVGICQSMMMPEPTREEQLEAGHHRRGHRRPRLSGARGGGRAAQQRRGPDVPRIATGSRG